ncbi:MAG: hypothetical protein H7338_06745 [Candidatus Sericytochromatia bacterium]|nr:hypothetical protein [Candidatus Sericytochromatia bacterium]
MITTGTMQLDPKLIPPQILACVFRDIDHNRDFDMGGYSVPTTVAFEQFNSLN